jgi:hypothetical protein
MAEPVGVKRATTTRFGRAKPIYKATQQQHHELFYFVYLYYEGTKRRLCYQITITFLLADSTIPAASDWPGLFTNFSASPFPSIIRHRDQVIPSSCQASFSPICCARLTFRVAYWLRHGDLVVFILIAVGPNHLFSTSVRLLASLCVQLRICLPLGISK